jgi:hypothetical protein
MKSYLLKFSSIAAVLIILLISGCGESHKSGASTSSYISTANRWPSSVIPVCWEASANAHSTVKMWIMNAVLSEYARTNVNLVGWGNCFPGAPGIHVGITNNWPHTKGLGRELDGVENGMELAADFRAIRDADGSYPFRGCFASDTVHRSCIENTAVHEFGHAVGLSHEHNRPDTPASCKDKPQGGSGDAVVGPWDGNSIMNYCNDSMSISLSRGDIDGVNNLYLNPVRFPVGPVSAQQLAQSRLGTNFIPGKIVPIQSQCQPPGCFINQDPSLDGGVGYRYYGFHVMLPQTVPHMLTGGVFGIACLNGSRVSVPIPQILYNGQGFVVENPCGFQGPGSLNIFGATVSPANIPAVESGTLFFFGI